MTDRLDPERRSENMRRIRSANTKPEITVRRLLHALGYRFRLHVKTLPGKPDIVLPRYGCIVLVHGCFWHSHPGCSDSHLPKSRQEYWGPKLERNRTRDREHIRNLKRLGWRVLVIWDCQTGMSSKLEARLNRFLDASQEAQRVRLPPPRTGHP